MSDLRPGRCSLCLLPVVMKTPGNVATGGTTHKECYIRARRQAAKPKTKRSKRK